MRALRAIHALLSWLKLRHGRLARPADPAVSALAGAVRHVTADLESLSQSTEGDFLAIGAGLSEFLSATRGISAELTALMDDISGEGGEALSQALSGTFEHCLAMRTRAEEGGQSLARLHAAAGRIRGSFLSVAQTVSRFRVVGTLARIETARLGGTIDGELMHLADEVRSLTESIEAKAETVVETAAAMDARIARALAEVAEMETAEMANLPAVVESILSGLSALRERQSMAHGMSGRLAERCRAASGAIEDLATSLQVHDITRQQVEHVIAGLGQLTGSRGPDAPGVGEAAVLALESSQLAAARRTFLESVDRITRSLDEIAAEIAEMARDSRQLVGLTGDQHDSFFQDLERSLAAILKAARECAGAEDAEREAARTLLETAAGMRRAVDEIGLVEIQMQRMAFNGQIRATQIGAAGAPLECLSAAMQDLAADSYGRSAGAAEALDGLRAAALRMSQDSAGGTGAGSALSLSDKVGETVQRMHQVSEATFGRVHRIEATSSQLCAGVAALRGRLLAAQKFEEVTAGCLATLARFAASSRPVEQTGDGNVELPTLHSAVRRYTMASEREVHRAVMEGAAGLAAPLDGEPDGEAKPVVAAGSGGGGDGEFGDNVELF
jgi:hypothetical protein